jgi:PIN domain nuclease of toxin-antitoxin system
LGTTSLILLDTHVWIYLVSGQSGKISDKALSEINKSQNLALCAISCWETALLVKKKRLILNMDTEVWIKNALNYPKLSVIDLTPDILVKSVMLEKLHSDPADRMIASTCLLNSIPLITSDTKLHRWGRIKAIW